MGLITLNFKPTTRQLRQFGAIGFVVFALIAAKLYFRHTFVGATLTTQTAHTIAIALWALAAACGIAALVAPAVLQPLFIGMSIIAFPIGMVVSYIILAIMFYGVITPVGLIMRLFGRDTMQRRLDPQAATYWQPHEPVTDARQYFRQS